MFKFKGLFYLCLWHAQSVWVRFILLSDTKALSFYKEGIYLRTVPRFLARTRQLVHVWFLSTLLFLGMLPPQSGRDSPDRLHCLVKLQYLDFTRDSVSHSWWSLFDTETFSSWFKDHSNYYFFMSWRFEYQFSPSWSWWKKFSASCAQLAGFC